MVQEPERGGSRPAAPLAGTALVIAVVVILEIAWSRLLVVLGSVEAVAFAAAGALFGTTVQRQRVNDQRARADAAESRADASETTAVNGQKLAAAVKVSRGTRGEGTRERLSAEAGPEPDPLLELANQLFPD